MKILHFSTLHWWRFCFDVAACYLKFRVQLQISKMIGSFRQNSYSHFLHLWTFFTAFHLAIEKKRDFRAQLIECLLWNTRKVLSSLCTTRYSRDWDLLLGWNKMKSKIVHNISNNFTSLSDTGLEVKKVSFFSINQRIFLPRNSACACAGRRKFFYVSNVFQLKKGSTFTWSAHYRPESMGK